MPAGQHGDVIHIGIRDHRVERGLGIVSLKLMRDMLLPEPDDVFFLMGISVAQGLGDFAGSLPCLRSAEIKLPAYFGNVHNVVAKVAFLALCRRLSASLKTRLAPITTA